MEGWIKLHRRLFESELWLSQPFTRAQAWIDLCGIASHKPSSFWIRNNRIEIQRGQIAWGQEALAKRWKWGRKKVHSFLVFLESDRKIVQQKSRIITIISIVNYDKYQSKGTTEGTTDAHQTHNRGPTYKNDKNVKNDKKGIAFREKNFREVRENGITKMIPIGDIINKNARNS